uniref:Uncharacterized protein n=1 Tax=Arundo donax TaxID=35708 RepID=A0A0A9B898_ARUDO
MTRAKKRNLDELLNGLTKEDLIRGVDGLMQTIAQQSRTGTRNNAGRRLLTNKVDFEQAEDGDEEDRDEAGVEDL